jgi:sec-independent protein translocase protein TatA
MKIFGLGLPELLIILAVILVIFGPTIIKRLKGSGAAARDAAKKTRDAMRDSLDDDDEEEEKKKPVRKKKVSAPKRLDPAEDKEFDEDEQEGFDEDDDGEEPVPVKRRTSQKK